jgi:hypothetical protein
VTCAQFRAATTLRLLPAQALRVDAVGDSGQTYGGRALPSIAADLKGICVLSFIFKIGVGGDHVDFTVNAGAASGQCTVQVQDDGGVVAGNQITVL